MQKPYPSRKSRRTRVRKQNAKWLVMNVYLSSVVKSAMRQPRRSTQPWRNQVCEQPTLSDELIILPYEDILAWKGCLLNIYKNSALGQSTIPPQT